MGVTVVRAIARRMSDCTWQSACSQFRQACYEVYATSGYAASVSNLSRVSLASDMVFSDGSALELASVSGSVSGGTTATLTVAV